MGSFSNASRRILIASANTLFREGLHNLYVKPWASQNAEVMMAHTMQETLSILESHQPDLVIVDYDDKTINRDEFLNSFMIGEMPMKVVLVSLASSEPIVIYDRTQMNSTQAGNWLANPWDK